MLRREDAERVRRFEFVERAGSGGRGGHGAERGLAEFLADPSLSGTVTEQELEFLTGLGPAGRRPNRFYYYRELQNLRDPLHFD